jgi:predicted nuclease of predicted toxin-antitoxin system
LTLSSSPLLLYSWSVPGFPFAPYGLVRRLRQTGVDTTYVNRILRGSETTDAAIAAYVDANDMLLITKDGDFRDAHLLNGTPARLLRITLGNLSNTDLRGIPVQRPVDT